MLFQPVREFIRNGVGDWKSFVDLAGPQFIAPLREGKAPTSFGHFFRAGKIGSQIVAATQFFVGPEHVMPPAYVRLGISSRAVDEHCHCVAYFGEKIDGYDGEITDLAAGH